MPQACDKYHEAWQLQVNSHAALYNWGVALSDMAHLEKKAEHDTAYHCLLAAAEKYALSLFYSPNNPQVCPVTCCFMPRFDVPWIITMYCNFKRQNQSFQQPL